MALIQNTAVCAHTQVASKTTTAHLLGNLAGERDGHFVRRLFRTLLVQVIELARTVYQDDAAHLRSAVESGRCARVWFSGDVQT